MKITRKEKMYIKSYWPWYDLEFRKDGMVYAKYKGDSKTGFGILLTERDVRTMLQTMKK